MNRKLFSCIALAAILPFRASAAIESFPIGTTWPDTNGTHINSHGGCVVEHEGAFYWFGESRTGGHSDGISVYRSSDLYNWENLGFAATHGGERDDENMQDISEGRLLERPKVIHNAKTGKWVMWAHWENGSDYGQARVAVLEADAITGPYRFVKTMRPNGHDSRDQTLFLDTDGNAYHFCSTDMNTNINVVRLSDDFLSCTDQEIKIMNGRRLEASTVCKVGETYFATFSECNGWDPAPGHTATATGDILGTWAEGLNFCVDPDENRSYRSQGAFVFSVGALGYDPKCFIFYGDRWNSSNVGGSTYVWLPMSVRSGYPRIRNYETWKLDEVMSEMYRYKRAARIENGSEYSLLERNSDRMLSKLGTAAGFCIKNDGDHNVGFTFESTSDPYVWRMRDTESGKYLVDRRGVLREEDPAQGSPADWEFVLLSDGYYRIINKTTGRCLTVEGGSRYDGTAVSLAMPNEAAVQAFAVYFDSKEHPNYAEADIYTREYFKTIEAEMARQNYTPGLSGLEFQAGKVFAVTHSASGLVLSLGKSGQDNRAIIAGNSRLASQRLTFTATTGGYNITDADGNVLAKDPSSNWNTTWSAGIDKTSAEAVFSVEMSSGLYLIRNAASGKYLGTDGSTNNSTVYCDKQERTLSYWQFEDPDAVQEVSEEDLFIATLDRADVTYGSIDRKLLGTGAFDYSPEAYAALGAAVEHGLGVTSNYAAEREALEAALAAWEADKTVLPDLSHKYLLRHSSGLYMTHTADGTGVALGSDDATFFVLEEAANGAYALLNTTIYKYLSRAGNSRWTMDWADNASGTRSQWRIGISSAGGKALQNVLGNGYIGCDNTDEGSLLYADKAENALFSQWSLIDCGASGIKETAIGTPAADIRTTAGGVLAEGNVARAEVFSLSGVCLHSRSGEGFIALGTGTYIVRLTGSDSSVLSKVVVVR